MKVLLTLQGYPPESRGGVETAVEALAAGLVEVGHDVAVFCGRPVGAGADDDPILRRDEVDGVPVYRYLRRSRRDDPIDEHDAVCAETFADLIADFGPDIVHVHHWHRLTNDLVTVATRAGVPAVVSLHDLWTNCSRFFRKPGVEGLCELRESTEACRPCTAEIRPMEAGAFGRSLENRRATLRQELSLARLVTYGAATHRADLERLGPLDDPALTERLRCSPLGVVEHLLPARRARELGPTEPFVVAHWGNLSALKGLEVLARAASRVARAAPLEVRLLGQEAEPGLVERLMGLAAPAVLIHEGAYARAELPERLRDVDLAVFPSLAAETFALVVDEAIANGLPVVVSDAGATASRVGGRGRIVPAGDEDALTQALETLRGVEARASLLAAEPGPISDRVGWAESLSAAYHEAVAEGAPSRREAPDRSRRRLAVNDEALVDIEWYVDRLTERYALARRALAGDEAARTELERLDP